MRVLATAAGSFSLAVFAANCIPLLEGALLPLSCVLAALCAAALLCLRGRARVRGALICGGLALGLLWTAAYGAVFYAPARALDDRTIRLSGTVMEYPQETDYGWSVLVRADGEPGAPVPTLVYADEQGADLRPGDRVETVAHCTLAERTFGGEEITYYTAKGIFLRAEAYGELRVTRPERLPLRYLPAELAHQLKQGVDAAFPEDAAPLIRALTTGNRDNLTDHYTSSLQRTGLSHTVAVSGMHLSFLAALVSGLLGRGKRRSALVTCGVVLVFTLISGCTPSVVRAAVMLILLQLAALLGRERDPLTALALALMLLLAWNPFSAAHIGLQLSFASVVGILLFSDRLQERMLRGWKRPPKDSIPLRLLGALVRFGAAALSATLGAMVFTTPLTALYFGSLSLISPLANLMTLWAVSAAFSGGLIAGAAGAVLPELGRVLALPVLPFVRYLDWVVPRLARAPFSALSTSSFYYLAWLLFVYVLLLLGLLYRGKKGWKTPVCACLAALCASLLFHARSFQAGDMTAAVLDVGQGQSVLIRLGDHYTLVDCGGRGYENAGDTVAGYLGDFGVRRLDLLVLTHFHDDHANGVPELLERLSVSAIALPDVEEDSPLRREILTLAEEKGIPLWWVRRDTTVELEKGQLTLYPPLGAGEANELGLSVLAGAGGLDLLVTGDMSGDVEGMLVEHAGLRDVELLVAGHHGSASSTSQALLNALQPETAILSVGRDNAYGHPAPETLERLERAGAEIYRTDRDGTVTVRTR